MKIRAPISPCPTPQISAHCTPNSPVIVGLNLRPYQTFLPLVVKNYAVAPNLVVTGLDATSQDVEVVIENQGNAATEGEFWVDLYIDPDTAQTAVNQIWQNLGDQGIAWGVSVSLAPGEAITLTKASEFLSPIHTRVTWPLSVGTPVYSQVDAYNALTTYGAILETHEMSGTPYDNISGPVLVE